jgi:hypothetical protein
MVSVACAPRARAPTTQRTVDAANVQPGEADTNVAAAGKVSVTTTPVAAKGPLSVTTSV